MPGLSFFQAAMSALSAAIVSICGAKLETYPPAALNALGSFAPSPPKTFAFLPCSASCCANACASPGFCVGKNTMSASLGTFVTKFEKSVTVFGDRLARRGHARVLERLLDLTGEALGVGLLEVDDRDVLDLQDVDHVLRVGRALVVVGRDDAEERLRRFLVVALGQRGARRRGGDLHHAGRVERLAGRGHRARGRSADHADHVLVGHELLRDRLCSGRALLDRCITGDELDLQAHRLRQRLDRELRPGELLLADEACTAGEGCEHADLERALAADRARALRSSRSRARPRPSPRAQLPRLPLRAAETTWLSSCTNSF